MRCPECEAPLDAEWRCTNGHAWPLVNGVRRCVNSALNSDLDPFLAAFKAFRSRNASLPLDTASLRGLPESGIALDPGLWRLRAMDLSIVRALIEQIQQQRRTDAPLRILDVGAWNGWLSNRLAIMGHTVTATDVFLDEYDGLGAVANYTSRFTALQFDQERLHLIEGPFDLVVAQRCLGYFVDLRQSLLQLRSLVAQGGTLFCTGVNLYRDPSVIHAQLQKEATTFKVSFGVGYFFKPVKGYLDRADERIILESGATLSAYPALRWKNFLSLPFQRKPLYNFATWHRPLNDA